MEPAVEKGGGGGRAKIHVLRGVRRQLTREIYCCRAPQFFFNCQNRVSSFRRVFVKKYLEEISACIFHSRFSMLKDRIFEVKFVQNSSTIRSSVPRGNISGKNARGNISRKTLVSVSEHTPRIKQRPRKGGNPTGGRVGKVATSRATPPAGLPTSGVRRGERRDEKRDLLCFSVSLCLALARANVPVRGKEIKRKRRKKGRCLWWCSATTPRAPRRETPRRRPPPPPQRRASRPSLDDDDDDDGETPLCMSVLGRLPAAAASERPKPSPRTSSRRGPSSRKRC